MDSCASIDVAVCCCRGRWGPHLQLNAVNDGDIVFMHQQSRNNRAVGRRTDYNRHYFTPGDSDRCFNNELLSTPLFKEIYS